MSGTDPDIEVHEVPPPPAGTPPQFRELVALALKTTDSTVLDAAEQDYRGVFASVDEFIHAQLREHLPAYLQWLPACCDPEKLRIGYERGLVRLWTIGLPKRTGDRLRVASLALSRVTATATSWYRCRMKEQIFWQVSAGKGGRDYSDIFLDHDVMFIGPGDLGEYSAERYKKEPSLRRFHDKVKSGDLVLMRRGARVIAIGRVLDHDYQHLAAFDDIYGWDLQHTRRVGWEQLKAPLDLFANPRMNRFGRVKSVPGQIHHLVAKSEPRELKPLPDVPPEPLKPQDLLQPLTARGLANAAKVCTVLEEQRELLSWYHEHKATRPNEHEVIAYLVLPLLRVLGWSEKQLAIEWSIGKDKAPLKKLPTRTGRADLAAFDAPSRAREHCVMLCEAKALSFGLGNTLPQPKHYANKLPNCRCIVTTQGSRFGIYLRDAAGGWPDRPDHYLNVERLRTKHTFPKGTSAVDAILALRPQPVSTPSAAHSPP